MKLLITVFCCLLSTAVYCREDLIEKIAIVVCDCLKEDSARKYDRTDNTSFTICTINNLYPYKKSIKKLVKRIIREDNKGDDLDALDAFRETFDEASSKHCPVQSVNFMDIFRAVIE